MTWLDLYRSFCAEKVKFNVRGLQSPGAGTIAFLERCARLPRIARIATDFTRLVMPMNDAAALFGSYRMLVADGENFENIMPDLPPRATVLDVGAGVGDTTRELRRHKCVHRIVATEASGFCCLRLQFVADEVRWTRSLETAVAEDEKYDLVSLLNVLDRTERPDSLLQNAARIGSRLLIGLVYDPFAEHFVQPHIFEPSLPIEPKEKNIFKCIHEHNLDSFESFVNAASGCLSNATGDFIVEAVARTPYICCPTGLRSSTNKNTAVKNTYQQEEAITFLDQALFLLVNPNIRRYS